MAVADYMKWLYPKTMKTKRPSKSAEEIIAALAAKKGSHLKIHRQGIIRPF
jgi:hypothetical protein